SFDQMHLDGALRILENALIAGDRVAARLLAFDASPMTAFASWAVGILASTRIRAIVATLAVVIVIPIMVGNPELESGIGIRIRLRIRNQNQERSEETRLNSSHVSISYAVFCLKKKIK